MSLDPNNPKYGPQGPTTVSKNKTIFEDIHEIEEAAKLFIEEVHYPQKYDFRKKWPLWPYFKSIQVFLKANRTFLATDAFMKILGICSKEELRVMYNFRFAVIRAIVFKGAIDQLEPRFHIETYLMRITNVNSVDNLELSFYEEVALEYEKELKARAEQIIAGCTKMRIILEK